MRRSDFDVTDKIRTTDPIEVGDEVMRLYHDLYGRGKPRPMVRAFKEVSQYYHGKHPDYFPCDTEYHDIQHVLDVTLTMARLLDGYARSRTGEPPLPPVIFTVGVVTALFHDFGYLRHRNDHRHRYGGEYTLHHVSRGSHFLRSYMPQIGLRHYAVAASLLVHFTGYERKVETIRMNDPLLRRVGEILGTADIIAQMADRCYLEKCRDRLYPEFVVGGLTKRKLPDGQTVTLFSSGSDLVAKTPAFYRNALKRLKEDLHEAYVYAETHFGSRTNIYLEEMNKNVGYAEVLAVDPLEDLLRRHPPHTLDQGLPSYPLDLVIV